MNYTLYDNSAALIAASEARHAGGDSELVDAERQARRAPEAMSSARSPSMLPPNGILGAVLHRTNRSPHHSHSPHPALRG